MTEQQKQKILDVMHTLSCIHYEKVINAKVSAKACHDVLKEVLDLCEPSAEDRRNMIREGFRIVSGR